jgi:hypothetical protein
MRSEISASYMLSGTDLDPAAITAATGIQPTSSRRAGDWITYPRRTFRAAAGRWSVESRLPLSASLDAHLNDVFGQLSLGWAALVRVGLSYEAEISCVVRSFGGDRPAIGFDRDVVRRTGELNADIDVDLYVFDTD